MIFDHPDHHVVWNLRDAQGTLWSDPDCDRLRAFVASHDRGLIAPWARNTWPTLDHGVGHPITAGPCP